MSALATAARAARREITTTVPPSTLVRQFAVGAAAGLVGTWVMISVQTALEQRFPNRPPPQGATPPDPPPVRMAFKISHVLLHQTPPDSAKSRDAALVSYGFGALIAGGYSVLCELVPRAALADGAGFGLALWVVGDEVTAPAMKVADPPWATPPRTQAIDAVAHVVYGVATDLVRRGLRGSA